MCVVPKKAKPDFNNLISDVEMDDSSETKVSFSHVLELAANNDAQGFKEYIVLNPDAVDEVGLWYSRQAGTKAMVLEYRTPLMVAAMYGSLDVMKTILMISEADVNGLYGSDKTTALHCAACGGSLESVKLLLANGANVNLVDRKGNRPYDVIAVSRNQPQVQVALEQMLIYDCSGDQKDLKVAIPSLSEDKSSELEVCPSPVALKGNDANGSIPIVSEKKEYPFDPSLPDIKNNIYTSDEFRMYSFKVRPCSRAYSHDWTECPFVHPGENARRRDPRKYHYSCVPCPEFRKGGCRRGDMCEYGHGVFECWLHPAQYRTRLCKDGTSCNRRVCFFAHVPEELRPLYASTGSAVMDMAAALNVFPVSPSSPSPMSPSPFTHPMSPSRNGSSSWHQNNNVPTLHLPGINIPPNGLQASRLRSSLNARDFHSEDLEFEHLHILSDMPSFSPLSWSRTLASSNLDELFSTGDMSSPRLSDPMGTSSMFSPSRKSAVMMNHFQQQQSTLSPINTNSFSPRPADHPMIQASLGPSSPHMLSPRGIDPQSPLNARLVALALRERSLSARDLGVNLNLPCDLISENGGAGMAVSPMGSWSKWESSNGRPDWSVNVDELNQLKRSYSIEHNDEPDLSWVQSLVKDPPFDNKEGQSNGLPGSNQCGDDSSSNLQVESVDDSTHAAWLDQIAA